MAEPTLGPRQDHFYIDTCDVWRFTEPDAVAGRPQPRTWAKIASNHRCKFENTESDFGMNAGMLLSESDMIFTLDLFHFGYGADVQVGDVLKLHTGSRPGFWRVRGNEKAKYWRALKQSYRCAIIEAPPLGVS